MLPYKNEWGSLSLWKDQSVVKRQAKKKNQFTEYKKMPQMGKLLKDNEGFRMRSNCPAAGLACGEGLFYTSPFEG